MPNDTDSADDEIHQPPGYTDHEWRYMSEAERREAWQDYVEREMDVLGVDQPEGETTDDRSLLDRLLDWLPF